MYRQGLRGNYWVLYNYMIADKSFRKIVHFYKNISRGRHTTLEPHHFFVRTTNDVTIYHYFVFFIFPTLLLYIQMCISCLLTFFSKLGYVMLFSMHWFCLKCILFVNKTILNPNLAQNGKYMCLTFFTPDHTLFCCFLFLLFLNCNI